MSPEERQILREIRFSYLVNSLFQHLDHTILHLVFWAPILGSASAAGIAAFGDLSKQKYLVAILAAIPTVSLTIESTFRFGDRFKKRYKAVRDLEALRRAVEIEHSISAAAASVRLGEIWNEVSESPVPRIASIRGARIRKE